MYRTVPSKQLDAKVISYERTKAVIEGVIELSLGIAVSIVTVQLGWPKFLLIFWLGIPVIGYIFSGLILPTLKLRSIRYELHPLVLEIMTGLFFKKREVIAVERIQHILVKEGPLARKFGIQSVHIDTAGTTHEVPLLLKAEGEQLRQQLMVQIKAVTTDV
ncbi:MAG: PH domain-containing protein [Carnobacterium sp.]|uniref:PH domain-containing protein n=1 Tax=unclassified Carnobacterium TaxID=257487 RepID=UPI0019139B3F|nr:PH domain-containing protein [Carnobacterium sp. CS13]QQP70683.1 PH domain-containing protein [Carnobacterium sp. CS13]